VRVMMEYWLAADLTFGSMGHKYCLMVHDHPRISM
jgi:hypothetical protein